MGTTFATEYALEPVLNTLEDTYNNSTNLIIESNVCYLETNLQYAIISSSLSFYIPLLIMSIVYSQIYIVAKRQAKQIAQLDFNAHAAYRQDSQGTAEMYLKNLS